MPNIALANMLPATSVKSQECDVVKVSSGKRAAGTATQKDIDCANGTENTSVVAENTDMAPVTKDKPPADFKSILEKQLSDNTSSDNSQAPDSQDAGQGVAVTVDTNTQTSQNTTTPETTGKTGQEVPELTFLAGLFGLQTLQTLPQDVSKASNGPLVTVDSKTTANSGIQQVQQIKTIQAALSATPQTAASRKSAVPIVDGAEKQTPTPLQAMAELSTKVTADAVEITTPVTSQTAVTDSAKVAIQPQTDSAEKVDVSAVFNSAVKQEPAATAQVQGQSKTELINEANKTSKNNLVTELEQQIKTATAQTKDAPSVLQAVTVESLQPTVRSAVATHSDTELLTQSVASSTSTGKAASFQQAFLKPSEQIIDQIQSTITGSVQQIRVTLSPEELGAVRITFRQENGQMEGLVEVQNPEVRKEVEKAMSQIAATLNQNGIQVRRMDITSMPTQQQTNQDSFQSPGRDLGNADQYYSAGQSGSGFPKGSGAGMGSPFAGQADTPQNQSRQSFDLTGLNMYA
jgi:hypothetical protein